VGEALKVVGFEVLKPGEPDGYRPQNLH
jgi:hypothetical protein